MQTCSFETYVENNRSNSKPALSYCKKLLERRPLLQICTQLANVTLIGNGDQNTVGQNLVRDFTKNKYLSVTVYERCIYDTCYFNSVKYTRVSKTDDSVVQLTNKKIIQIHYFVKGQELCYICGCE